MPRAALSSVAGPPAKARARRSVAKRRPRKRAARALVGRRPRRKPRATQLPRRPSCSTPTRMTTAVMTAIGASTAPRRRSRLGSVSRRPLSSGWRSRWRRWSSTSLRSRSRRSAPRLRQQWIRLRATLRKASRRSWRSHASTTCSATTSSASSSMRCSTRVCASSSCSTRCCSASSSNRRPTRPRRRSFSFPRWRSSSAKARTRRHCSRKRPKCCR
mmetsp:Transcript_15341/g.35316  ORF Transcript_15341/g.35316 Transcript_15341/m.35316 type:complete len:216 (-) Transcript_15341:347-994(-)